tara:strand:+ start:220 stop:636 length:417 start_codon:yes stop_codon:yes gene_type:complete
MNKLSLICSFVLIFICTSVQGESGWENHASLECTQDNGERSYHFVLDTEPVIGMGASSYWKDLVTGNEKERVKSYASPFNISFEMRYCRDGSDNCKHNWDVIISRKTLKASIKQDYYEPKTYENYICKKVNLMEENII